MLAILRVVFGFALFSVLAKALRLADSGADVEGTLGAGYLALAVIVGIANAVVWAPFVGRLLADPLTGAFTSGHPADLRNDLLQLGHRLALRRWRRMALAVAFVEGVRRPDLPGAFVLGLNHAAPGTWLEKVFAREVWRFDNAENCLKAWRILERRGCPPGLHGRSEVNLLIHSQQRPVPPPAPVLFVPPAPPPPAPRRNERIALFAGAPEPPQAPAGSDLPKPAENPEDPPKAASATEAPKSVPSPRTEATPPERLGWRDRLRILFTGR